MDDLSYLGDRIGGFAEYVEILAWPRTQVHNRLKRERERSEFWIPGQLPRPFMRVTATPLFDLDEIRRYVASPQFKEHEPYYVIQEITSDLSKRL
jgi:hypothetical protein